MYVYEDSNFGGSRISHVYAYAHKWRERQGSATFEFYCTYAKRAIYGGGRDKTLKPNGGKGN